MKKNKTNSNEESKIVFEFTDNELNNLKDFLYPNYEALFISSKKTILERIPNDDSMY